MRAVFSFLALFCMAFVLHGITVPVDTLRIESRKLNETRNVLVFYPDTCSPSESVDILYMLDGEWSGDRIKYLNLDQFNHPVVVVGILNTDRNRDLLPVRKPSQFLGYIEEDLFPVVEKSLEVRKRILYGHSFAGGFAINAMIMRPGVFDMYIASSPVPIKGFVHPGIFLELDNELVNETGLYFSYGSRDMRQVRKWSAKLQLTLDSLEFSMLEWENEIFENKDHNSSAVAALIDGMDLYNEQY